MDITKEKKEQSIVIGGKLNRGGGDKLTSDRTSKEIYGYIRVSTIQQNDDRQRIAMAEQGVPAKNIFSDKQSGKDFNRPGYKALLSAIREGDKVVIKSIDRLGRNFNEILEQWRHITLEKKCGIVVLDTHNFLPPI